MEVHIRNCNNIDEGILTIEEGRLNIKYGINGTGKSTIVKAIEVLVNKDEDKKKMLTPFKYSGLDTENEPQISGCENIKKVCVFNEKYIDDYIFQSDELIKNSFDVFIKSSEYDKHMKEIEGLLRDVNVTFQKHPELDELISVFTEFVEGFGKAKSGYNARGMLGQGLGKGNKIDNIPFELEMYGPYLRNSNNVKWIKWQLDGKEFLDMADQCPYCTGSIKDTKETILKVEAEYDAKSVDMLNKILEVFKKMHPYLVEETNKNIDEIKLNVSAMTDSQRNYLLQIKEQVLSILKQLNGLKQMGFHSLKNKEKLFDEINKYKIDLKYYSYFESDTLKEKVGLINQTLDTVLEKAGKLQGEIAQQKLFIKRTIELYSNEINEFLYYAGYKYVVSIEEDADNSDYRLVLKHIDASTNIQSVQQHLSYGERNAFALVLFMYSALREEPDLIVLDDPISSFDGNKKFAILNKLFRGRNSFRNRTVLLLTHEFGTVIDVIKTMWNKFEPAAKAHFLSNKKGILKEKEIMRHDIKTFGAIVNENLCNDTDSLNKLIYLRRLFEINDSKDLEWEVLSSLFHKRPKPTFSKIDGYRELTGEERKKACLSISEYVEGFDYDVEYNKTQDMELLRDLYINSGSNYEKLMIYRVMFNENNDNLVIRKFVNEVFHIENDYLVQLNPREYDTVPQYVIDECDKDVFVHNN